MLRLLCGTCIRGDRLARFPNGCFPPALPFVVCLRRQARRRGAAFTPLLLSYLMQNEQPYSHQSQFLKQLNLWFLQVLIQLS